ncbi:hypothetical protein [Marinifilum caeruleilacunae]|uniref:HupE / UreJ protein n=1 Tax=Marinifilum caeruleilacunae TaxID=2499076 RepID=A0ABX1WSJ5_9BACT|nr:hypothetical protein [Marinifilum caeruleilacunae]NOU58966.1 hypothetical protein [Marinifilum caeruleilacunae]
MQDFLSGFESAFSLLISLSSFDHFLLLLLFGIVFQLKDWKSYFSLLVAISIGTIAGFLLAAFKVTYFSASTIKLVSAIAFCAVGIHHMVSNSLSANAFRYNFFALIGLITGTSISLYYLRSFGSNLKFFHLSGYSLGVVSAFFVISFVGILISSLMLALFKTDRRKFNLAISGIGVGMAIMLIYLRY